MISRTLSVIKISFRDLLRNLLGNQFRVRSEISLRISPDIIHIQDSLWIQIYFTIPSINSYAVYYKLLPAISPGVLSWLFSRNISCRFGGVPFCISPGVSFEIFERFFLGYFNNSFHDVSAVLPLGISFTYFPGIIHKDLWGISSGGPNKSLIKFLREFLLEVFWNSFSKAFSGECLREFCRSCSRDF